MLKITATSLPDGTPAMHLEGKLSGPWADELLRTCAPFAGRRMVLFLSDVTFVDGAGELALRQLHYQGAEFHSCSGFVTEILSEVR